MVRTKLIYLVGKSETELLAYDEYDSGTGKWFTDNPKMANEYYCQGACEEAEKEGLNVYLWEVTYSPAEKKVVKEELWLQFSNHEAVKWKNEISSRFSKETPAKLRGTLHPVDASDIRDETE
jgi:hypothetical protein